MEQKLKFDLNKNTIVCGDCCNEDGEGWLNFIPDNRIDCIYIDPPFYSNQTYETIWGNGYEKRSFDDRRKGDIEHYIKWMKPKILEGKRLLKKNGSIFLHCDGHANYKLRCLLDDVFGKDNFLNEIIWSYDRWTAKSSTFQKTHDTIFYYAKNKNLHSYKTVYRPHLFSSLSEYKYINNPHGQRLTLPKEIILLEYLENLKENGKTDVASIPITMLLKFLKFYIEKKEITVKKGERYRTLRRPETKGTENDKQYLKDYRQGVRAGDVISDIPYLTGNHSEKCGYNTQKPEDLIKKFIKCSTQENDIVLDFFGGGGTTAKICSDLNRKFIIGDISPVAVRVIADRLSSHSYRNYEVKGLPSTKKDFLRMNPHKFADMICEIIGWETNPKKTGDGGIDGFANKGKIPIQIKNHKKKTGRPDIQKFLGALNKYEKGFFVSWGFSSEAWGFRASIEDKEIKFFEVGKLLNGLLISDNISKEHEKLYEERVKKSLSSKVKMKQDGSEKSPKEWQESEQKYIRKIKKKHAKDQEEL